MICICGAKRIEHAKYCLECGIKFNVSSEIIFKEHQEYQIKDLMIKMKTLHDNLENKIITNDKDAFRENYVSVLTDVKNTIDFHINNVDHVITQFFEQEVRNHFLESIYNHISKNTFEKYMRVYDNNLDLNDDELILKFKDYILQRKESVERVYRKNDSLRPNDDNKTTRDKSLEVHSGFERLLDEGLLLELLKYKHSTVMTNIKERLTKEAVTPKKYMKKTPNNNDLIEIIDFALALTSPVSAARYFLKTLKDK